MRGRGGESSSGFEACLPPMVDISVGLAIIALLYAFSESLALGKVEAYLRRDDKKAALAHQVQSQFPNEFRAGKMTIGGEENVQRFTFNEGVLFRKNEAGIEGLVPGALGILQRFGRVLVSNQRLFEEVIVEGHTDERAIDTARYPSNWELSAARATTLVHIFSSPEVGLQPSKLRIHAAAYGQYLPLAAQRAAAHPNWSEDRKERDIYSRDRRVVVAVYYSMEAIRRELDAGVR